MQIPGEHTDRQKGGRRDYDQLRTIPKLRIALARAAITVTALLVFLLLRQNTAAAIAGSVQSSYRRAIGTTVINTYLRANSVRKLQIGAGGNSKKGWLNTDIEPAEGQAFLDASKQFPLEDGSFQFVYNEHVIEHLTYQEGLGMLKESHRILSPGGKIRIATPDLLKFINLVLQNGQYPPAYMGRKLEFHNLPRTPEPGTYIFNIEMQSWGHQFVYTPALLRASLEAAGFRDIKEFTAGESDDPAMRGLEGRANWTFRDVNSYETMVLQATR